MNKELKQKIATLTQELKRKDTQIDNIEHGIGIFASTLVKVSFTILYLP